MKRSKIFSPLLFVSLCFSLHGASCLAAGENGSSSAGTHPLVEYSETAAEPVIEYTLVHDMLGEQDPEPLLRIYGNGRVHVHYPVYMKKAGDYELQLSQSELRTLLRTLATDGIIDFDPAATRSRRKQHVAQQQAVTGEYLYISDSSHTVIDIRLEAYQKGPGTARVLNLQKRFTWPDLKQDARRFPQLPEITKANKAAQHLDTLLHRDDLVKIR